MQTAFPHHPKDPLTHLVTSEDDFIEASHLYGAEHGVVWDRSGAEYDELRQSYTDLFNDRTGLRSRLEALFEEHKFYDGTTKYLHIYGKRGFLFGNIHYRNDSKNGLTREFNAILNECPQLKHDIELAVDRITNYKNRYANIWLLSDYPGSTNKYPILSQQCHADPDDTYYIQIGGAPLRLYPNFGSDDTDMFTPGNGDVVFMRGKRLPKVKEIKNINDNNRSHNGRFMFHAGNIDEWKKIGRLSFSIF